MNSKKIINVLDTTQEEIEKYSDTEQSSKNIDTEILTNTELKELDVLFLKTYKYILDFFYGNISFETILSFTPNKLDFNKKEAQDISFEFSLHTKFKETDISNIPTYLYPCIIFNKKNEPFVLISKNNREISLFNPYSNNIEKHSENFLKNFKSVLFIYRDKKNTEFIENTVKKDWFFKPLRNSWRTYIEIGILSFFINLFALAIPLFTMNVYDRVIPNNAFETLGVLSAGVIILILADFYLKSTRNYIIEKTSKRLGIHYETELMRKLLTIQNKYNNMMVGMKSNLFRELHTIKDFFSTKSVVQIIDFPFFFVSIGVIYIISPLIASIPIIIGTIIIGINFFLQIPIERLSKERIDNMQTKQNNLVELIQSGDNIKMSNAVSRKLFDWQNIIVFYDTVALKIQSLNMFSTNSSQMLMQILTVAIIFAGVYEISNNNITVGGLIAISILSTRAMVPIVQLSSMIIKFKDMKQSLDILTEFFNLPSENDKVLDLGIGKVKGKIEFKNVDFFYKDSKYPAIKNLNIVIKPGEKVGIIGQTGAGKSTILKMILGLDHPTKGSVFLDNYDLDSIHSNELRQFVGVMPQEPFLFEGTLKENIEMSNPISKEKMDEVIRMTGLENLIKKNGQGDNLNVGERGRKLSVGQRHLVVLARALVRNPNVLILDEPTTGLDVSLENILVKELKSQIKDKTLILISHKFSALDLVDRLIVLAEGQVLIDGKKEEVLNKLQGKK